MKKIIADKEYTSIELTDLKDLIGASRIKKAALIAACKAKLGADTSPLPGEGHYMALDHTPLSGEATAFANAIAGEVNRHLERTRTPTKESVQAAGAVIADLMRVTAPSMGYCYRSKASDSFIGAAVGRAPFRSTIEAMEAMGLVEGRKGYLELGGGTEACSSRYVPTPGFIARAKGHGIDADRWSTHFEPMPRPASIPHPIVLKAGSTKKRVTHGDKIPGKAMQFDRNHPVYTEKRGQIDYLNSFLAKQELDNCPHRALQRIYNNGDSTGADFNEGGRVYSIGGGYQSLSPDERARIVINGEPTAEIDIGCCQPSILSALSGKPLDPRVDAYGLSSIPRDIIKMFVAQTMGSNKLLCRWTRDHMIEYGEHKLGMDRGVYGPPNKMELARDYPIERVKVAAIKCIPVLADWDSLPYRWGTLQNVESDIIIEAMVRLAADHGIPSLPVHDSLIVPVYAIELTKAAIANSFEGRLGVCPRLKC